MTAVEALAQTLYERDYPTYSPDAVEDHNRWSWQGDAPNDGVKRECREQAAAILAALPVLLRADTDAGADLRARLGLEWDVWRCCPAEEEQRRLVGRWEDQT